MNYKKIALITALVLGASYGGFKLVKYISRKVKGADSNEDEVIANIEAEKTISEPDFDGNIVAKIGMRGGEVKTIQTAFNNIISDASKPKGFTGQMESRRERVAMLTKLDVDGIFGIKTQATCQVIMGEKSVSYNQARDKRIAFSTAYGLGNPYSN